MKKTIGFLGGGNMGKAIITGLISSGLYEAPNIFVFDVNPAALTQLHDELGITPVSSTEELAKQSAVLVISVKPNILPAVLGEIAGRITKEQLVVSIAAGITLTQLTDILTPEHKVVRVMPNTPALVGEGMSAISVNKQLTADERQQVLAIFQSFGKAELVDEKLMDAVVGVSGSSPAYVYLFIEALADGAVAEGMPRPMAYQFAAQTVLGSAKMVLETGKHPGELKDQVCSPGGTTILAVNSLEQNGFRAAAAEAVRVAAEKNRNM
ncbi:pyrroline-5-carboxylate reductase [Vagococcus acidifermentans]|uniref:Pyrroline-5-carboxylate reductase n=1 Tax=Vagococcus acidifermentans TaxID=564710 RepID=A0A430B0W8_9ENTE|nr:pyrroline-5-carboxylate reductase [Vagococcus acidifermentans]RSU13965.1 pyrroline-5-carboxylate reductase [Vagococcus acidifermentans]